MTWAQNIILKDIKLITSYGKEEMLATPFPLPC